MYKCSGRHTETKQVISDRTDKRAAFLSSSSSMCWDSCRSNSFLMRVTGQLSRSVWRGSKGEKTHFLITNRYLHVPHLHSFMERGVIGSNFFFQLFTFNEQDRRAEWQEAERLEHTAALTAGAAWWHAWVRSHVWVWTRAGWVYVCRDEHVCRVLHLVLERWKVKQSVSAEMMLSELWPFCCSLSPATTGTPQTVESLTSA